MVNYFIIYKLFSGLTNGITGGIALGNRAQVLGPVIAGMVHIVWI